MNELNFAINPDQSKISLLPYYLLSLIQQSQLNNNTKFNNNNSLIPAVNKSRLSTIKIDPCCTSGSKMSSDRVATIAVSEIKALVLCQ